MTSVFFGLGSNMGDRFAFIEKAVLLVCERIGAVSALSSMYETKPWGFVSDNDFINAVMSVETSLAPAEVLERIKGIEAELGRVKRKSDGYEDRTVDIDILFYGDKVISLPSLVVPHPKMLLRRFVMEPLAEIAPDFVHPVEGKTVAALLREMPPEPREMAKGQGEM